MFGRKAAYRRGYVEGLQDLKAELFADAKRRNDDRQPYSLATLSEHVINTVNALIRNPRDGSEIRPSTAAGTIQDPLVDGR